MAHFLDASLMIALVTVFLSRLAVTERGPFAIFERMRRRIQMLPEWALEIKFLFSCPICLSVWVSALLVLITRESIVVWPASCAMAWLVGGLGGWGIRQAD